jgi:HlyD family secretion protein
MSAFSNFIKRPSVIVLAIIVVVGFGVYFLFVKKSSSPPETFVAKRGIIMQEVSVTGKTKAAQDVDLAFEKIGKIALVNVQIGDKVFSGQTLVVQVNSDIAAQLEEARASVKEQEATLEELKKGTRPEEIQIQEVKVVNAKADLLDKIQDAYTKSDDAVRNKTDQLFSNSQSSTPVLVFVSSLKQDLESSRVLIEFILNSWKSSLGALNISSDLNSYITSAESNLNQIKLFLGNISLAVNSLTAGADLSQTTIDTYKSAVSTARANVNTAITNLTDAESTYLVEQNNLILEKAGSTPEQIAEQEAKVAQASANVKNYEAQLSKTILLSPINGVVTRQDAKVGEIVAANNVIVSVISSGGFELEANVPEADIAKVKVGDTAKVTLDAFGSDKAFEATVTKIDPGETIIEGVATYKTTFSFIKGDEGIKSGMTANIDILTAEKENVIVVPQRLVVSKDGEKFVRVLGDDGIVREIKVETGLRGSDGNIEIISGLSEGDKAVISLD